MFFYCKINQGSEAWEYARSNTQVLVVHLFILGIW
jgi:hypothetical protein